MQPVDFAGISVPPVTPFHSDGSVDHESYRKLLRHLLAGNVSGIVVNGTTGESPTVSWQEVEQLTAIALEEAGTKARVIVGTGSNDTASTIQQTERAKAIGAQAALVVVPYYSRPSQAGLVAHYRRVAEVGLPIIAYNIPYRTGVALDPTALREILDLPAVVGLKESTGGLGNTMDLMAWTKKAILCGEDLLFFASVCLGGAGGILASAHIHPAEFVATHDDLKRGDLARARARFLRLVPIIKLLFEEPNPAPLKWALAAQGIIASPALRLPLVGISDGLKDRLKAALAAPMPALA